MQASNNSEMTFNQENAYTAWNKLANKISQNNFQQQRDGYRKKQGKRYSEAKFLKYYSQQSIPEEVSFICKEILPGIASGKITPESAMAMKLHSYEFNEGLRQFSINR